MCGMCGGYGAEQHWTDGAEPTTLAERHRRAAATAPLLARFGLTLRPWADRYTLADSKGQTAVVDHLGAVWPVAERMRGSACDPLDPAVLGAAAGA